ncbi:MAG TPA: 6-phosphofructokinase [Dehalococcoidia bacterium]|jgi:6-phosphofructokinase 1|nr:6-phosphofructokinase [Dehalococcoidia bacterium]HIK89908.1 6-phosphofructokinase [Dehalococcoidia bacterium]
MAKKNGRIGILVGGGPAPGINSVIAAAVIEAVNSGYEAVGFKNGYEFLVKGDTSQNVELGIDDVTTIHTQGGSILHTSRTNPTKRVEDLETCVATLKKLDISHLITIGGDDTAFGASEIARAANGEIRVAHVPKTIDNDLPLPGDMPTFGYETARHVGAGIVMNLKEDSRTTNRWYFIVAMGRHAGHLALGIGKAAASTITLIPEEFPGKTVSLSEVCDVLEGAILKCRVTGRPDGVAIIAEGIASKLNMSDLRNIAGVEIPRDEYGNIRLADLPLARILRTEVERRFKERGEAMSIVDLTLGYELRSAAPIPFDIDYTRTLGHGAVRFLLEDTPEGEEAIHGAMICIVGSQQRAVPFEDMRDPETGKTAIRMVDTTKLYYDVARRYMIRLEQSDLEDEEMLKLLADSASMHPEAFKRRFRVKS